MHMLKGGKLYRCGKVSMLEADLNELFLISLIFLRYIHSCEEFNMTKKYLLEKR